MTTADPSPTFSISLPALRQSEFIATALSSISAQHARVEMAVMDASPDDSVQQVLRAHAARTISWGYHRPDAGQASAIQDGWDHTSGDIVAWLCADDYYFPGALALVADAFRTHPECDVVFGHGVHVSPDGAFEGYFPATRPDPSVLTRGCSICQPACFVRREAMTRVGGLNRALHYCMDWDFWLRLHRAGARFMFLDAPLAAVRVHPATKTMSGGRRRRAEIATLLRAQQTDPIVRWRTELAFWRQDLRHPDSHRVVHYALDLAASVSRRARHGSPTIRGLECGTNRVLDGCDVGLPWYADQPASEAIMVTDWPVQVSVVINERPGALEPIGVRDAAAAGRTVSGHGYRIPLAAPSGELLSFRFQGQAEPWRLLGLEVR